MRSGRQRPGARAQNDFDLFVESHEAKYPKAVTCLQRNREELLAFYDIPAKHWQSICTNNPIESTFGISVIAPSEPKAASAGMGCPNSASVPRSDGEDCEALTILPRSLKKLNSKMELRYFQTIGPPPDATF